MNVLPTGDWLLASFRSRSRHLPGEPTPALARGSRIVTRCGITATVCHWKYNDGRFTDCKRCAP